MKQLIIAALDLGTETFGTPFFVHHVVQATRQFIAEAENPESQIAKHAKDYELWQLGTFDDQNGSIESNPLRLIRAIDFVKG